MVRTRFAPSPTGHLHIGGVRTALFNWLYARHHNGQFILRIDDTDQQRNVAEALQPILDGFRWLGIDWDEGPEVNGPHAPYYQSQRAQRYDEAVAKLLDDGLAYRDFATTDELAAEREVAAEEKRDFVYSRRWMAESAADVARFEGEGRSSVVRLKMPREGSCSFHDLIRGDVEFAWSREQDHVIQRADGSCLYHLASVIDDADFLISHVIRAEEHLPNTPRQRFIAESLGLEPPQFAHLPYVAETGGTQKISKRKLSKYLKNRDFKELFEHGSAIAATLGREVAADTFNPVIVDFYREVGYLPEAILNYLVLLGWSLDDKTETFSREEMVQQFSLERVNRSPASFDPQKLRATQVRYMQAMPSKKKVAMVLPYIQRAGWVSSPPPCETGPHLAQILVAADDRIKVAGDILEFREFFVADDDIEFNEKAFGKRIRKPNAIPLLIALREELVAIDNFNAASTEAALRAFIEAKSIKMGNIIHALRVAVTGKTVGLGMFDTLEILGRESCLARIDRACQRA
ncbi:MAG TPA: glutamate--tRNA ligase [Pirellulaceae bacterium]|nr:glutamate--tRNA ligase [Pirellulaceae bacterium]